MRLLIKIELPLNKSKKLSDQSGFICFRKHKFVNIIIYRLVTILLCKSKKHYYFTF